MLSWVKVFERYSSFYKQVTLVILQGQIQIIILNFKKLRNLAISIMGINN